MGGVFAPVILPAGLLPLSPATGRFSYLPVPPRYLSGRAGKRRKIHPLQGVGRGWRESPLLPLWGDKERGKLTERMTIKRGGIHY